MIWKAEQHFLEIHKAEETRIGVQGQPRREESSEDLDFELAPWQGYPIGVNINKN